MINSLYERLLFLCVPILLLLFHPQYSPAQEIAKFPSKPITLINPAMPGSTGDTAPRLINKEAERFLGQPIVSVNKPGGAMTIGVAALVVSKPDGYTIGHTPPSSLYTMPFLEKIPYNPVRDIRQIMQYGSVVFAVYVRSDSPFKTFKDLIAFARENPKKLTYGTSGLNSIHNIVMEYIARKSAIEVSHIPFKGGPEVELAVLGGHVSFGVNIFSHAMIEAGKTRLLLLLMEDRLPEYPQVPTSWELGYDIPCPGVVNVAAPKGIPDAVAARLEQDFTRAMKEPAFEKGMKDLHLVILHRDSKQLTEYVTRGYELFGKVIKEMHLAK
jgi:tripartite-type tricarboxylate transporter receptor subunit TctC